MRILAGSVLLSLFAVAPADAQETAADIIDRVDRIMRGESSHGVATMEIVTEHWQRAFTMELWSLGTDYALIRIIKIPASMMMGAWMGSHFTNDDLVKESRLVEDYDIEISFEGERDGTEVWEFMLTPKAEAAVVWGHIEYRVRKGDLMPLWARYYDEDGALVRTMDFSEFQQMGGRVVPALMEVTPIDKPGERTTVRYESLEFDIDLDTDFFSLRNLKAAGR
jgi:hypothetical protein